MLSSSWFHYAMLNFGQNKNMYDIAAPKLHGAGLQTM